ncbi:MAG: hypothetical protein V1494_00905 [Candidatus Diapherotrites archaeon]
MLGLQKALNPKLILLALLLASVFIAALPRLGYLFPLHGDEYDSIAAAQGTISSGVLSGKDPYIPESLSAILPEQPGLENGFTSLISFISIFSGIPAEQLIFFLPALLLFILSLSAFVLFRKFFPEKNAAFSAAIFSLFLPSSVWLLGMQLMVPSSLGLALFFPLLFFMEKSFSSKKYLSIFLILMLFSAAAYPPAFIFAALSFFLFFVFTRSTLRKKLTAFFAGLLSIEIATVLFSIYYSFSGGFGVEKLLASFPMIFIWGPAAVIENFLLSAPASFENFSLQPFNPALLLLSLAVVAIPFIFLLKKIFSEKTGNEKFFLPVFLSLAFFLFFPFALGFNLMVPFERALNFFLLFCLAFSGAGFCLLFKKISADAKGAPEKFFPAAFFAATIFLLFFLPFSFDSSFYKSIDGQSLPLLEWISSNTSKESVFVILPPALAKPVAIYTGRKALCTSPTRFQCTPELSEAFVKLFFASCDSKKKLLEDYGANFLLQPKAMVLGGETVSIPLQQCPFLVERFNSGNALIYEFTPSS